MHGSIGEFNHTVKTRPTTLNVIITNEHKWFEGDTVRPLRGSLRLIPITWTGNNWRLQRLAEKRDKLSFVALVTNVIALELGNGREVLNKAMVARTKRFASNSTIDPRTRGSVAPLKTSLPLR